MRIIGFKGFLTSILAISIVMSSMPNVAFANNYANADGNLTESASDKATYILTSDTPESVLSYAKEVFSSFANSEFEYLNLCNNGDYVRLASPFTVSRESGVQDDYESYFFPVLTTNGIEGVLIINVAKEDNTMSYQMSRSKLADALNEIETSFNDPVEVCVNGDCYYAADMYGNIQVLSVFNGKSEEDVVISYDSNVNLKNVISVDFDNSYENEMNVCIFDDTDDTEVASLNSTRSTLLGVQLPVVFVANESSEGVGVCWASCVGCLVTYYGNTSTGGTEAEGLSIKKRAISDYGSSGTINTVVSAVYEYANVTLVPSSTGILSWSALKTKIQSKKPAFTKWITSGSSVAHGMVLSGYSYDSTDSTDTSKYRIYVMDPNEGTNVAITYNGTYLINDAYHYWSGVAYKE